MEQFIEGILAAHRNASIRVERVSKVNWSAA